MTRKFRRLSDGEILRAINDGVICADSIGGLYYHGPLKTNTRRCSESVRLHLNGGRRDTTVARLVWMCWNRKVIPPGYVVGHLNDDRTDHSPMNLELMRRKWK